jgi:hypothetical protein
METVPTTVTHQEVPLNCFANTVLNVDYFVSATELVMTAVKLS